MKHHIAYYITAHGYGHGVRSCDILAELFAASPEIKITVTTDLPESFLRSRLPMANEQLTIRPGAFDVGMVQKDSIRVDVPATLERALQLVELRENKIATETRWLREVHADVVVSDIPSIPIEAAAVAGMPAVAIGNFSWDWIYEPFVVRDSRWRPVIQMYEEGYRKAQVLLKLPFSPAMDIFENQKKIPLLAKPGRARRDEIAALTSADPAKQWVLLSFTTLEWNEAALQNVETLRDFEFFTVLPLTWGHRKNIHAVDRNLVPFSDVLATCDAVVTKPGYGILSDCVANAKPIIYAEREDFIEYPLLARELKRYLKNIHIPAKDLYAGKLQSALAALSTAPPAPETLAGNGAAVVAKILLQPQMNANERE